MKNAGNKELLTGKDIDEDYKYISPQKAKNGLEISKSDIRMIEDFHGLQDAQKKRLLKYIKTLKQMEELEEDYGRKHRDNDFR